MPEETVSCACMHYRTCVGRHEVRPTRPHQMDSKTIFRVHGTLEELSRSASEFHEQWGRASLSEDVGERRPVEGGGTAYNGDTVGEWRRVFSPRGLAWAVT